MDSGILLVGYGKPSYWDEAATLVRSLRRHSPGVSIAIASDLRIPEQQWRRDGYDMYVPYDFRDCGGVSFKMHLDRITPYRDATLFIDSDSICYRDIRGVFDAFRDRDFVVLGKMLSGGHWFEDPAAILREFKCDAFPFFCGDFYLFRRTETAASVFNTARDIAARFRTLGIRPIGGWCNDEPAFSLAMTTHGIPASPGVGDWIIQIANAGVTWIDLNYATGEARATLNGAEVAPRIVHFSAHRSQPLYFRERCRVRQPSRAGWRDALAPLVGQFQSVHFRARRRLGI